MCGDGNRGWRWRRVVSDGRSLESSARASRSLRDWLRSGGRLGVGRFFLWRFDQGQDFGQAVDLRTRSPELLPHRHEHACGLAANTLPASLVELADGVANFRLGHGLLRLGLPERQLGAAGRELLKLLLQPLGVGAELVEDGMQTRLVVGPDTGPDGIGA